MSKDLVNSLGEICVVEFDAKDYEKTAVIMDNLGSEGYEVCGVYPMHDKSKLYHIHLQKGDFQNA